MKNNYSILTSYIYSLDKKWRLDEFKDMSKNSAFTVTPRGRRYNPFFGLMCQISLAPPLIDAIVPYD